MIYCNLTIRKNLLIKLHKFFSLTIFPFVKIDVCKLRIQKEFKSQHFYAAMFRSLCKNFNPYLFGRSRHFAQALLSPALAPNQHSPFHHSCCRRETGLFHGLSFDLYFAFLLQNTFSKQTLTYSISIFPYLLYHRISICTNIDVIMSVTVCKRSGFMTEYTRHTVCQSLIKIINVIFSLKWLKLV